PKKTGSAASRKKNATAPRMARVPAARLAPAVSRRYWHVRSISVRITSSVCAACRGSIPTSVQIGLSDKVIYPPIGRASSAFYHIVPASRGLYVDQMNATRRFRELLNKPSIIRSLGAHDVFTARLIEAAGLETVFLGGFGTSASLLGLADVGFITLGEMADAVRRMAMGVNIPVVADGDTGHGDLHNVVRTVREFE